MVARIAFALLILFASSSYGKPTGGQPNSVQPASFTSIRFLAGDTSPSDLIPVSGTCVATFARSGSDVVTLYQTGNSTPTGGTQVGDTFSATTTNKRSIVVGQPYVYAVGDGASGGSVLTIECSAAQVAGRGDGVSGSATVQEVPSTGDPWISCSGMPDPGFTPVAVTTADDLHQVVIDECASGCILELASGTYDDTNVTIGPAADGDIKAGSLDGTDITGEILIRAANPNDPPVLRSAIGSTAAIFHVVNNVEMFRLENLILDGRRSEQTEAVFTECTDTTPADGICDDGTQSQSFAQGVHIRSTLGTDTRACLLDLEVRETASDAIYIRDAIASTVQGATTSGSGCSPTTCPNVDIPLNNENNNVLHMGRGVNLIDSTFVAAVDGNYSDATKQGAQCYGSTDCYIADNTISDIGSGGITMLGSSGFVWRNTVDGVGILYPPNTTSTSTGSGYSFTDHDDYTGDLNVEFVGNTSANTHGAGFTISLLKSPAAESSVVTLTDNTATGACQTSTLATESAFRLGDNTDKFESIVATGNTATGNRCPDAFRIQNAIAYTADDNVVTSSSGAVGAVYFDDVEALDDDGLIVDTDIEIDADSVGTLTNCTLNGSATITGALEGNVTRTNCGPAQTGGSSNWGELEWDADDWG